LEYANLLSRDPIRHLISIGGFRLGEDLTLNRSTLQLKYYAPPHDDVPEHL
jgi:hypothetical protein